jgi:hypothetical protein
LHGTNRSRAQPQTSSVSLKRLALDSNLDLSKMGSKCLKPVCPGQVFCTLWQVINKSAPLSTVCTLHIFRNRASGIPTETLSSVLYMQKLLSTRLSLIYMKPADRKRIRSVDGQMEIGFILTSFF